MLTLEQIEKCRAELLERIAGGAAGNRPALMMDVHHLCEAASAHVALLEATRAALKVLPSAIHLHEPDGSENLAASLEESAESTAARYQKMKEQGEAQAELAVRKALCDMMERLGFDPTGTLHDTSLGTTTIADALFASIMEEENRCVKGAEERVRAEGAKRAAILEQEIATLKQALEAERERVTKDVLDNLIVQAVGNTIRIALPS